MIVLMWMQSYLERPPTFGRNIKYASIWSVSGFWSHLFFLNLFCSKLIIPNTSRMRNHIKKSGNLYIPFWCVENKKNQEKIKYYNQSENCCFYSQEMVIHYFPMWASISVLFQFGWKNHNQQWKHIFAFVFLSIFSDFLYLFNNWLILSWNSYYKNWVSPVFVNSLCMKQFSLNASSLKSLH